MQTILVLIIFAAALGYLAFLLKKQFSGKKECGRGCSCSAADLAGIEERIKNDPAFRK